MTKQAQLSLVAFMIAVVIVILALAFAPTLNQVTTKAMASNGTIAQSSLSEVVNINANTPYNLKVTNTSSSNYQLTSINAVAKQNSYAVFNGSGVSDIRSSGNISLMTNRTGEKTISLWFYTDSYDQPITTGSDKRAIILLLSNKSGSSQDFRLSIHNSSSVNAGKISIAIINSVGTSSSTASAYNLTLHTWNNIIFTLNQSSRYLYINGVYSGAGVYAGGFLPYTNLTDPYLRIGSDGVTRLNSSIDDVIVWNRSLTYSEIVSVNNSYSLTGTGGSPVRNANPDPNGLVAFYSFDEGNGTISIDHANFQNNGTNTNVTWFNGDDAPFSAYTNNATSLILTNSSDAYRYLTLSYRWQWYDKDLGEVGGMNCAATGDDFVKAGCQALDLTQVLFIGGLIALAGVIIAAKIIFG